ncbi:hypothetical protein JOC83_000899 [Bacillus iocasae]|uniref:Acyltransferase 3 domain-containing protein n=1 Tax=Priestia iocasae TaxID=2291674 RepID=A0ABS2QRJ3_9BACI|nr:hypothetical protein [Metabacillus iocasae]
MNRQYDLDWIRVAATVAVFVFHCTMFANAFPWHVKNNELNSGWVFSLSLLLSTWLMPIFFAISGISVRYALERKTVRNYITERLTRLGIPLLLGIWILSPPQVYIERISYEQFNGSFLDFIPHYVDGLYLGIGGSGNFAFVGLHLWYLLVLLVFSILTLPLFRFIQHLTIKPVYYYFLPIPLVLLSTINIVDLGSWDIFFYVVIFIYGYYFFHGNVFQTMIQKTFWIHLLIGVSTSIIYTSWFIINIPEVGTTAFYLFKSIRGLSCWSSLITIFYLGHRYLRRSNHTLAYTSEAAMPVYILHQPVIVIIGFFIKDLSWSVEWKLTFLFATCFSLVLLLYHVLIRPFNVMRFLFGLKQKPSIHKGLPVKETSR